MKRMLLFCGGAGLALIAEAILWFGPRWYLSEERARLACLGFLALGAVAAAWAGFFLSHAIIPSPTSTRQKLGLTICAFLFAIGAFSPFAVAWNDWDILQGLDPQEADANWPNLREEIVAHRSRALTFGVLYVICLGPPLPSSWMLMKPMGLQSRRPLRWPMKRLAWGIGQIGLLLFGVSFLIWLGNGLAGEAFNHGMDILSSLGILGGSGLVLVASFMAMIEMTSN